MNVLISICPYNLMMCHFYAFKRSNLLSSLFLEYKFNQLRSQSVNKSENLLKEWFTNNNRLESMHEQVVSTNY